MGVIYGSAENKTVAFKRFFGQTVCHVIKNAFSRFFAGAACKTVGNGGVADKKELGVDSLGIKCRRHLLQRAVCTAVLAGASVYK